MTIRIDPGPPGAVALEIPLTLNVTRRIECDSPHSFLL
jgi:hypothetical protein